MTNVNSIFFQCFVFFIFWSRTNCTFIFASYILIPVENKVMLIL